MAQKRRSSGNREPWGTPRRMVPCDLCGQSFQYGPHAYLGNRLPHYDMMLCRACFAGNWDGFGDLNEAKFEAHLTARGIPLPKRNAKGWYPRDL